MEILADYQLSSDLRLPDGDPPMVISSEAHHFHATITNIGPEPQEEGSLACRLVFEAPSFDDSEGLADQKVVKFINALTYTTNRKFAVVRLHKVIEWTPGIRQRRALLYQRVPLDHRAEPSFTSEFAQTAEYLLNRQSGDQQHSAMRWYRLGIQSDSPEEQFSYFWFALEIVAQVLKSTDRAPSKCPVCRGPLYCENCETHPTHRPYPGEAIRQVVARVQTENPDDVFETLQKIRHTVMHGDRLASIEHELPCTADQAVTKLAQITWNAIAALFDAPTAAVPDQLMFGHPETVLRHTLVARVSVMTELLSDHECPRIENFPNFNFSVDYRMSPPRDITNPGNPMGPHEP
jgi:hypothetical protein